MPARRHRCRGALTTGAHRAEVLQRPDRRSMGAATGAPEWRNLMTDLRRMAILPVAVLVLAACQSNGAGSSASPSEGGGTADITNVVCVGEATTYLDWLNGDFQPDDPDPIEEADEAGDLLETIRERGEIVVSTRPELRAAVIPRCRRRTIGLRHRRGEGDRRAARRRRPSSRPPEWDAITAGSWSGRWDISVGSMTVTVRAQGGR